MSFKILIVEDSPPIIHLVQDTLKPVARIDAAETLGEARRLLKEHRYDLMLLDLSLPDGDGTHFLNEIQAWPQVSDLPVLILSGKGEVQTKIVAFNLGALDYIQKPFEPLELRARVEAHLKRRQKGVEKIEAYGLKLEIEKMRAWQSSEGNYQELNLTQTEFKILLMLLKRSDFVFSREQILDFAWGAGTHVNDRTVDAHVSSLRKKLGSLGEQINSVRGIGYKFTPPRSQTKAS